MKKDERLGYIKSGQMMVQFFLMMACNMFGGITFLKDRIQFDFPDLSRWREGETPCRAMQLESSGDLPKAIQGLQFRIVPPEAVDYSALCEILEGDKSTKRAHIQEELPPDIEKAMREALKKAGFGDD